MKFPVAGIRYIISNFDGKLFQHLVKHNATIYGPLAIIQSLHKTGFIPESTKPLLAMYCDKFNVTVTGLNDAERTTVREKIVALGGIYSPSMTSKTTHLIAKTCDAKSEKYQRAVKDKIMIVSPAWVDFAYEAAKHEKLSDSIPFGTNMIKVFTGCFMTSSGYKSQQQQKISEMVRGNGGRFSGIMEQKTCTHLLLDSKDGEKYRKAVEWKTVKIVTLKWLMKCVEDGIRYEEDKYHPGVIPSTQMLVRDDSFFDADSADPFHHLSNQNLFGEIKAKNVQETNILPSKNDNNGKSAEEEATVSEDNGDKSEKQNVEPMDIDRPVLEDDQQAVVAENEKSNQVEPVKEATKASTSKQDMDDDDDSFTKTWSEVPIAKSQQQKVTKVKPRRRIFGIYEESEEGTDDSEANRSAAILSRVRPKPKRRLPAPEPEANSDDSIQIAEEAAPSPPQPTDNSDALNAQPTEAIDTKELCKQIQDELVRLGISQTVFAVKVADRSQKTVSETLKNPKAWEKLGKKGQYIYIRMYNWIKFSEQRRLSHFQNNEIKNYKQIGIDSEAVIQNRFEFPRHQQTDETKIPEIAQFKASQRLSSFSNVSDGVPHTFKFGAPSRELYIGGHPFRGAFGGPPMIANINGRRHEYRLCGPPPEVRIDQDPCYELSRHLYAIYGPQNNAQPKQEEKLEKQDVISLLQKIKKHGILNNKPLTTSKNVSKPFAAAATRQPLPPPPQAGSTNIEVVIRQISPPETIKEFQIGLLMVRYSAVIEALHKPRTACPHCGIGFTDIKSEAYQRHIDGHVQDLLRTKESKKSGVRTWNMGIDDWLEYDEMAEVQKPPPTSSVGLDGSPLINGLPASPSDATATTSLNKICTVCHEKFNEYYDDNEEEWKLQESVIIDNSAVHRSCVEQLESSRNENNENFCNKFK